MHVEINTVFNIQIKIAMSVDKLRILKFGR